ncbi:protein NUCLEAR FUSION DEFECTIVE 4 [Euphorbia lathyris]|uniref:protein NUCLEAR FUSION DEFECTIVE 4 n=1 Tax=Euphorbia lathyris TaxID=212925 RepID=UPI003313303A
MSSSTSAYQWLSLVGIIWVQSVNGTNTNFPAYSSQLKHLLSMTQIQLNNLAFASDAGKLFGFISGIASSYLPLWLVLLIGATLGLIGYGVQYLFLTSYISSLSYVHIFLLTIIAGNSICWINTVCYLVSIRNFPTESQVSVGITTSYQGLSAKIYTVIVDALFSSSFPAKRAKAYLLLNSTLPFLASVIAAPLTRSTDFGTHGRKVKTGFLVMFVITVATGIYAVISTFGGNGMPVVKAIGILVFLLCPILVPIAVKMRDLVVPKNGEAKVYNFSEEEGGMENGVKGGVEEIECVEEEIGGKKMLLRVNFWLYFSVYLSGATVGLVYLNNLGQIAESRGCLTTSSLVSLSSSFGFFGRLIPSLLDFFFLRSRQMISRPGTIAALMAPMAGAFFLLIESSNTSLYISTAIIGVCTGAITSISVSTTTQLFGTKNFSINHNLVVANIPIGSFIFGYLAALIYHKEGTQDGKCFGIKCYQNTFILWGSLCFLGTFLALILHSRMRNPCSQKS